MFPRNMGISLLQTAVLGNGDYLSSSHIRDMVCKTVRLLCMNRRALIITYTCVILFSFKENTQLHYLPVSSHPCEIERQEATTPVLQMKNLRLREFNRLLQSNLPNKSSHGSGNQAFGRMPMPAPNPTHHNV